MLPENAFCVFIVLWYNKSDAAVRDKSNGLFSLLRDGLGDCWGGESYVVLRKIKDFIYQRRFFLTLLLYFIAFLIPVLLVGVISYYSTTQVVQQEFHRKNRQNLSNVADTIDDYLISSHSVAVAFLGDDSVKRILVPNEAADLEQKAERWRISKVLERYQNITSNFIDSIFVYFPGDSLVYLPTGGVDQTLFFQKVQQYETYDLDFWMNLDLSGEPAREYPAEILTGYAGLNPRLVCPWVRIGKINGYTVVVVMNISMEQIGKTLESSSVIESTQYLVTGKGGGIVWNTTEIAEGDGSWQELARIFEREDAVPRSSGYQYITVNGREYIASRVVTSQFNWQIYSLVPLEGVNGMTSAIPRITLAACLLLAAAGIVLALFFSKRIYKPINSTIDALRGQYGTILEQQDEQKDELELLQLGVDRLVESQAQYRSQLNQYGREYLESAFRLLFSGANLVNQETLNQIIVEELGFREPNFVVCCVCFRFHPQYYMDLSELQRCNVAEKLRNILASLFEEGEIQCYVMEPRQNIYTCLLNCQEESKIGTDHRVFARMQEIFCYDRQYYDVAIGIGGLSYSVGGLRDSYRQAITEVQNAQPDSFFQVQKYRAALSTSSVQIRLEEQQKMMNALKAGSEEQLRTIIGGILDGKTKSGISFENYRYLYHQIMMVGVAFLSERGKSISELSMAEDAEQVLFEMKIPENPDASRRLLDSFFHEVMELCADAVSQRSSSSALVEGIQEYVERYYGQEMGLEQIAEQMGVSVKYVSRAFKQRTGKNLTDYINELRVQKAKKLLAETEEKVGDIAAAVGIGNRTTFLRVFKKYEGISPNEYRNLKRAEGEGVTPGGGKME